MNFSSTSPLNNQSSESSENSATSDSSESEGEENNPRSDEEDSSHRTAQPEVKNEIPEENKVTKWNLQSFLSHAEQKSPNEAPPSNEPVKAVKNVNHDEELPSDEDESNDDSDDMQRTPQSEHNFNHVNENSNNSSIPDKSSDHEHSMPPPAKKVENKKSPIVGKNPDMEHALAFIKTLQPIQPIQPLLSLSDSDGKVEMPTVGSPLKKKKQKRSKPVSVAGDSSSDEENANPPPSSKGRRRKSLDNAKIRGRPKKSNSSNSLPASYDQQLINSDNACNGAKKLPTPQHKSPRVSKENSSSSKKARNVKSKATITSSDDSNIDEDDEEVRSPSKKQRHPELSKKHPPPPKSSSSGSSSSSSSQSDSDHSTKNYPKFSHQSKIPQSSPVPINSRPSSSLQHQLPPAASSVHRNDSSDQSDSDYDRHVSKGKVKEAKNPSGDKTKHILIKSLFAPKQPSEGLGKGGKNGGKKPIGQVVVVTEDPKLNNDNLNNCHVQNHHPKYLTASPSSAFSNNSSASNLVVNPSVMVS